MAEAQMSDKDKKKEKAAQLMRAKNAASKIKADPSAQESRRVRRRARELFTNAKASGKIPKDAKFEDFPESKFFKGAKDNAPGESRRKKQKEVDTKFLKKKAEERAKPDPTEAPKSRRVRRRAREIFTNLKATGKIPKDAKFEDLSEDKFFQAAKDNAEGELRRKIMDIFRKQSDKMRELKRKP